MASTAMSDTAAKHSTTAIEKVAQRYTRFAVHEAQGVSDTYDNWARAVARHRPTREFLATLPAEKQQPNLLFAAVRFLFGLPLPPEVSEPVA